MKLNETISKIIANHVLGEITPAEKKVLQDWLSDSYNSLMFEKITKKEKIAAELSELNKIDSGKAYQKFKTITSKKKRLEKFLAYAATILIPLGLGVMAFYFTGESNYADPSASTNQNSKNITILSEDGKFYEFTGKDTLIQIANAQVKIENQNITYEAASKEISDIPIYNTISIPVGKRYKLELSDGSIVHLNSQTTLKYPIDFTENHRNVLLLSGEAFFEVEKDDKPFIVDFGINKIQVLGTKFNVRSYDSDGKQKVTLEEGSIALKNSRHQIRMLPNQQAVINQKNQNITIDVVDASIYSSWRNGILNYKEEKLSTILNDLQRQYHVKLFYQNQEIKNKKLSISIHTTKNIRTILKAIEATGDVKFEIKNSNIIIMKN